jgi:hypothetical protein
LFVAPRQTSIRRDRQNVIPDRRRLPIQIVALHNLVSWRRQGREKLHFINPVPINEIAERWIGKFDRPRLTALSQLKDRLEGENND